MEDCAVILLSLCLAHLGDNTPCCVWDHAQENVDIVQVLSESTVNPLAHALGLFENQPQAIIRSISPERDLGICLQFVHWNSQTFRSKRGDVEIQLLYHYIVIRILGVPPFPRAAATRG